MDYNANINWIVAGLPDGRKVNVINSFYVKFERHGWTVEAVYIGNPMRLDEKYLLINQAFAGKQRLMPFINRQNNDDLIHTLQSAGVTSDRNGSFASKAPRAITAKTKPEKNSPKAKKIYWNIEQTELMRLIHCTLVVKSFRSTTLLVSL